MIQKLTISLALPLLLSVIWLAANAASVPPARATTQLDAAMTLSGPAATLAGQAVPAGRIQASPQAITITFYLPVIYKSYCSSTFSFNESLGYNLNKISVTGAWAACTQGQGVIVAVVDSGIDLDHPDLQTNIVPGRSFVAGVSSPDDDNGHGTHVAGIVAGVPNNGGIIGVAPRASLMPVKVLSAQGSGSTFDIAAGVEWAVDHGATVINLSLGSVSNSATLEDAVNYAYNRGALVVAAGGNCGDSFYFLNGCSSQDQTFYPAAFANVMAVASTTSTDNQSSFSTEGSYIEIAAPGSNIYSTYLSGGYITESGTSMAAPHVAGLAALIWSNNQNLTNQAVRTHIRDTATDLGPSGWDSQFGYGRINAGAALNTLQTGAATTAAPEPSKVVRAPSGGSFIPGEVLLKLQPGLTTADVLDLTDLGPTQVKVAGQISQLGINKLAVAAGQEQVVISKLLGLNGVAYAELNYTVTAQ